MLRRLFTVAVGTVLIGAAVTFAPTPTLAEDSVCDPGVIVTDPEPFQWTDAGDHFVGVLEYGEATFDVAGETLTTRAYRQEGGCYSIPGPTMHMQPGNRYVVRFRNLLPYEPASPTHNEFKDPNVTNLHTHGLHISGEAPADDVTRMFEGGTGGDYVYDIPADHMGGTFWYHAHHHGSTFLQVSTGGFGLIVIDDGGDGIPDNVAAMDERQVLIGYLDTGAAGTGGDQLVSGTLPAGWTVNGSVNGTFSLPPDTWQHWRILLADRDARMKTVSIGDGCEAELLARDGVWRTTAPKDLAANSVDLTGASRADLAVRCTGPSTLMVDGDPVATITTSGSADPDPHPYAADGTSTWSADRPDYLRDLRGVGSVNSETVSMGARTVNGSKFDIDTPTFRLPADAVQEWTIRGAGNHPFHLHVYHFQPVRACGDFEAGEYYDTIASNCTVRFDLNAQTSSPYQGRTIMHCHILAHEDQGAMTWMDVVGGTPPPSYPAGHGYAVHYQLTTQPPSGSVEVESVVVTTVGQGRGFKSGQATVTVVDSQGTLVAGAVVDGDFSGTFNEPGFSGTTGGDGTVTFTTTGSAKGGVTVTFCLTSVSHPDLADWSGSTCGTS